MIAKRSWTVVIGRIQSPGVGQKQEEFMTMKEELKYTPFFFQKSDFYALPATIHEVRILDKSTGISEATAAELLALNQAAKDTIVGPISHFTMEFLTSPPNPYQCKWLVFATVNVKGKIAGYGYSYLENKRVYYIEQVFVHPDHRKLGIASEIIWSLISFAFESIPDLDQIECKTQVNNAAAAELLLSNGFNYNYSKGK